jgi:hypothetical protein
MIAKKQSKPTRPTRRFVGSIRDPDVRETIGEIAGKLVTLRRLRGYETACAAAEVIGINKHVYNKIERGGGNWRIGTLAVILRGLEASLEELAAMEPSKPNRPGGMLGGRV